MKIDYFSLMVVALAVWNIWYGAICWILFGLNGLLLGSCFMLLAGIIGVYLRGVLVK
jgi:hypothetical protein